MPFEYQPIPASFNLADFLLEPGMRDGTGSSIAIRFREQSLTYNEVHAQTHRLARALLNAGLCREDRVGLWLPDCPAFLVGCFASWKIGAVAVPIHRMLAPSLHEFTLDLANLRCLLIARCDLPAALPLLQKQARKSGSPVCKIVVVDLHAAQDFAFRPEDDETNHFLRYDDVVSGDTSSFTVVESFTHSDDVAVWAWTSGSTGPPKASLVLHKSIAYLLQAFYQFPYTADDIIMSAPKMIFSVGLFYGSLASFHCASKLVLVENSDDDAELFSAFLKHRPTVFVGNPAALYRFLPYFEKTPNKDEFRSAVAHARAVFSGGFPLPLSTQRAWKAAFNSSIYNGLGSSEAGLVSLNVPGANKEGSVGKPFIEWRIVDPDGKDVPQGEIGILWVRSPGIFAGYYRQTDVSQNAMRGKYWYITGDRFMQDSDGYFWYKGRENEAFKLYALHFVTGTELATTVENSAPDLVKQCVVLPPTDQCKDIVGFVILQAGVEASDAIKSAIFAQCPESSYWKGKKVAPTDLVFVDSFPRMARGKIDATKLREMYTHAKSA